MKRVLSAFALFIIMFSGCSRQQENYPDIKYSQILTDLNWSSGPKEVKALLTGKYKLDFNRELEQGKPNSRVLEFTGGKVEGINTHSWEACFNSDSLTFLVIKVDAGSATEGEKLLKCFKNGVGRVSLFKVSSRENEWTFSENNAPRCALQLSREQNGIVMLFSSNIFIRP